MPAEHTSPPRRVRPKERKQQILASAANLFVQHGFPNVTMNSIAESVDITAGALYRHYPNKAQLLEFAIRQSLDSFPAMEPDAHLDEALALACEAAVRHRELGPLWSRQLRYLPDDTQAELRRRLKDINRGYIELIRRYRPALTRDEARLLAWSVQGVLSSPGNHSVVLPATEFADILRSACHALCNVELVGSPTTAAELSAPALEPASRRERLLQKAIRLFGAKGVHATSMEDIGATAGVTGPSLYSHFDGKEDILRAALDRATQALWLDLGEALHHHDDTRDALRAVVGGYVRMTLGWLQLTSLVSIDSGDTDTRSRQREYVGEWVALIRACRPEVELAQARILVHAALAVIHDISRTPGVENSGSLQANLTAIALAVLGCGK